MAIRIKMGQNGPSHFQLGVPVDLLGDTPRAVAVLQQDVGHRKEHEKAHDAGRDNDEDVDGMDALGSVRAGLEGGLRGVAGSEYDKQRRYRERSKADAENPGKPTM